MTVSEDATARLESLNVCAVLDTPREPMFDNVIFTLAQIFRASMAALILVAPDRVWAKADVGMRNGDLDRVAVFCDRVIETGELLIVEDVRTEVRFAQSMAALGEPCLRFCAAVPVLGPGGYRIGVLCVMDRAVKRVSSRQLIHLRQLADQVGELLLVRVPGLDVEALKQARH